MRYHYESASQVGQNIAHNMLNYLNSSVRPKQYNIPEKRRIHLPRKNMTPYADRPNKRSRGWDSPANPFISRGTPHYPGRRQVLKKLKPTRTTRIARFRGARRRGGAGKTVGSSNNIRTASITRGKNKKVDFKTKRVIKVPKGFKQKVKKSMELFKPRGTYEYIGWGLIIATNAKVNQQTVGRFTNLANSNGMQGIIFDPTFFLHAASCLWNGQQLAANTIVAAGLSPVDPNTFDFQKIKIDVINCSLITQFTNNSQRVYTIKIYECAPKSVTLGPANFGTDPLVSWANGLTQDASPALNALVNKGAINTTVTDFFTLYEDPRRVKSFNALWTVEETVLTIEPGQTVNHVIKGPSDLSMDYSKYWQGTSFVNQQKFTRQLFYTTYLDQVSYQDAAGGGANAGAGRLSEFINGGNFTGAGGVLCESRYQCQLAMPEQTGLIQTAATIVAQTSVPLTYVHRAYGKQFYNLPPQTITSTPSRVDEMNPSLLFAPK